MNYLSLEFSYIPKIELTIRDKVINAVNEIDQIFNIRTKTRKRIVVLPRQYVVYIMNSFYNISQEDITEIIGGFKERSVVVHSKRSILTLLETKSGVIELEPYIKIIDPIFKKHGLGFGSNDINDIDFNSQFESIESFETRMASRLRTQKILIAELKRKLERSLIERKSAVDEAKRLSRIINRRKK